ncbi:hypothetical protein HDV00_012179 [Rhizophlyctis rosea]|nr:hypothetical protein HDV00_012179 [Rhizophlyctis rosea]
MHIYKAAAALFLPSLALAASSDRQCGGVGFQGNGTCPKGWSCVVVNKKYSECQNVEAITSSTRTTTTTTRRSSTKSKTTTSKTATTTTRRGSTTTTRKTSMTTTGAQITTTVIGSGTCTITASTPTVTVTTPVATVTVTLQGDSSNSTTTVPTITVSSPITTSTQAPPSITNLPATTTSSTTSTSTPNVPCTDIYPGSDGYTCEQQAGWGQCSQSWMSGYCLKSCNACPVIDSYGPFAIGGLIDASADDNTQALWTALKSLSGKKMLSGQAETADASKNRDLEFEFVKNLTGHTPAVRLFDFIFYVGKNNFDDGSVERAIAWHNHKGIVQYQWHWFPPNATDFYTANTNFSITAAVTPGTPENTGILADIQVLISKFKLLAAAGVPVLFRPLHEPAGGWFWWGAQDAVPYLKLWDIIQEEFGKAGIHNVIWVHNFSNGIDKTWYPGTNKVDVVSVDRYSPAHQYEAYALDYYALKSLTNSTKLIAMAENGPIPNITDVQSTGAIWSYFATWNSDYILTETYNTFDHVKEVYNSPIVVNLEDL